MVYTFNQVKKLRSKHRNTDQRITGEEKKKLEEYIEIKEKVNDLAGDWSSRQLADAKLLMKRIS